MSEYSFQRPWPRILQWLCGVFVHQDRNYSDGNRHGAYCLRCGKLFGYWWAGAR